MRIRERINGRDGLTAAEIVLLDLDREWEVMTEREAEKRAREIADLYDLALEVEDAREV